MPIDDFIKTRYKYIGTMLKGEPDELKLYNCLECKSTISKQNLKSHYIKNHDNVVREQYKNWISNKYGGKKQ